MSRRPLAAALLAVAAVGFFWYALVAPSRGHEVEPGVGGQVLLDAAATGAGGWVRYALTVKNVGDQPVTGDLLLVDADDGDAGERPAPLSPASLGVPVRLPRAAESAGQSAYRLHVTVPAHRSRVLGALAPEHFTRVLFLAGSRLLAEGAVDPPASISVAVLSDVERAATAIGGLRFDRHGTRVAEFAGARAFPASALALAGFTCVVIDQFDSATLSPAQTGALRDFVGLGGSLVVAGGEAWRRTLAPLPQPLQALRPTTTAEISLAPVAALAGGELRGASAPAAVGTVVPPARTLLATAEGVPLVAELSYGAGRVVQLAFDPAAEPVRSGPLAQTAWGQAIGRTLEALPGNSPTGSGVAGADPGLTRLLPAAGDAPLPPPALIVPGLLGYVLLIGPLNYWLLRRRPGRSALMWLTAPMLALAFSGSLYWIGEGLRGPLHDQELDVVQAGPDGAFSRLEYHRVLFLGRGDHRIDPAPGTLAVPLTLNTHRLTGSTCERCTGQLGGLAAGAELVTPGSRPTIAERGIVYGSVRVVASAATGHGGRRIESELAVSGGRLRGTVRNPGPGAVHQLELHTHDGQGQRVTPLAARLGPGETVSLDREQGPAGPGPATGGPAQPVAVLRQVASGALARGGQPVLVALIEAEPSGLTVDGGRPPRSAWAVLEQPVSLAAADGWVRSLQRIRLAATSGDERQGFLDTYDVELPRQLLGGVRLAYSRPWSEQLWVYDWQAGGFEPVPVPADSAAAVGRLRLLSGQVRDGMVRVRVREPRLSPGQSFRIEEDQAG